MRPAALLPWLLSASVAGVMLFDVSITGVRGETRVEAGAAQWPSQDAEIGHVLNRVAYGPRPGDIERVRAMGVARYLDEQLHPSRVADPALAARLSGFTSLSMSNREIAERFAEPLLRVRAEQRREAANAPGDSTMARPPAPDGAANREPQSPENRQARQQGQLPLMELSQQKLLRAVHSDRQLEEVLTDFWFNHFNVDARKGQSRFMLTEYERDAIRPHVLGKFRDLLGATAKSPAMLFYLDNWMSADPDGPHVDRAQADRIRTRARRPGAGTLSQRPQRPQQPQAQGQNMRRGLNENYGRELLELHTLGVDGGYTQKDVTEVARAFTGWTIENPRQGGSFRFAAQLHDDRKKTVLGHTIEAGGGQQDGERVLDILAEHPSTARFISKQLAVRFVSDEPSALFVNRLAATFTRTHGDLRAVMTALLTSQEFLSPDNYRAKVKTPLEFVVSALRATAADIDNAQPAVRWLQQLGMPLYQCQPPTGYKDTAETWVNTGALVNRMNVALAIASGSARGIRVSPIEHAEQLIAGEISQTTRDTIARAKATAQAAALGLGAPEFQRR